MLYFPPQLNYSFSHLREVNENYYNFLMQALDSIAIEELGVEEDMLEEHRVYTDYVIRTGMVVPRFQEIEGATVLYFDVWSVFKNKYVRQGDLPDDESELVEYFLGRMFHVN